jgi:hypothetical protein
VFLSGEGPWYLFRKEYDSRRNGLTECDREKNDVDEDPGVYKALNVTDLLAEILSGDHRIA